MTPMSTFTVSTEFVAVLSAPSEVTASNPFVLPVLIEYSAEGDDVVVVPIVRRVGDNRKFVRSSAVLNMSSVGSVHTARVDIRLGSWALAGAGYSLDIVLIRSGQGWTSRFARSER